jgi:hypothetical protein
VTGKIDGHDIEFHDTAPFVGAVGMAPIFVSGAFDWLATRRDHASLQTLWRAAFLRSSKGDRRHLNGPALDYARAAYAPMPDRSDTLSGWREEEASTDVAYFRAAPSVSPGWPSRRSVYGGGCGLQPQTEGDPDDRDRHALDRTAAKA